MLTPRKKKWYRLCNRHRWIPVILGLINAVVYILLFTALDAAGIGYLFAVTFFLLSFFSGATKGGQRMSACGKVLTDQCDPYPLLAEADDQLSYVKNAGNRTNLVIDRSAALCNLGERATALTELEALNIDDPVTIPAVRHAYSHNLTVCAVGCGKLEKAQVYYQKMNQQLDSLKGKAYNNANQAATLCTASLLIAEGRYDDAYQILGPFSPVNRLQQVGRAYWLGQIALAQNQPANAKIYLEFVAQQGNRLYIATQARNQLATLSE